MKTKIKFLATLVFTSLLLNSSNVFSQFCANLIPLPGPNRYEAQMPATWFFYVTTQTPNCPGIPGTSNLPGMAINITAPAIPNYMLDILSNLYVGDGVNVSDAQFNSVGYSIGGTGAIAANAQPAMFLWHSGDTTLVYTGLHSGFGHTLHSSGGHNFYNTIVGNGAAETFGPALAVGAPFSQVTAMGYRAPYLLSYAIQT